jgi:hypothetical protein
MKPSQPQQLLTGWKVFFMKHKKPYSALYHNGYRKDKLVKRFRYSLTTWNYRREDCGPFALFGTREEAKHFVAQMQLKAYTAFANLCVMKVTFTTSKNHYLYIANGTHKHYVPSGTLFADSFKIIED